MTAPHDPGVAPSGDDRRRSDRAPHVCEAWIASPTRTDPFDRLLVHALNLSKHGVGFDSPTPLATGTFHDIQIVIGEQTVRTEIRITHCRRLDDGHFEVGGEFC
jgi:hypothetical protein